MSLPLYCACFLIGVASMDCPGFDVSEATLIVSPEAATWRQALLDWSTGLKSFKGSYTVSTTYMHPPEPDTKRAEWFQVHYRFRDDAFYSDVLSDIKKGFQDIYVEKNGFLYYLTVRLDAPHESVYLKNKLGALSDGQRYFYAWPPEEICVPQFLFGQDFRVYVVEGSVKNFLAQGYSCVISKNGQQVFAHFREGRSIECQFDKGNRPERLGFYMGCICPEELRKFYLDEYGFDTSINGEPWVEICYSNYKIIGDIFFPLHITKYVYQRNEDAAVWASDLKGRLKALGSPDIEKIREESCKVVSEIIRLKMYEATRMVDINYAEGTLSINVPLEDNEFEIELPTGTKVFEDEDELAYREGISMPPSTRRLIVLIGLIAGIMVCLAGMAFWLSRRK